MAQEFAQGLYNSKRWQRTRNAYKKSVSNLCERCLSRGLIVPAEIVHHKIELTPQNVNNPDITLSFDNLQALCRECHAEIHEDMYNSRKKRRFSVDEFGRVLPL